MKKVLTIVFLIGVGSALCSPINSMLAADGTEFNGTTLTPYIEATNGYAPYLFDENPISSKDYHIEMEFSVREPFLRWYFLSNAAYREVINSSGKLNIGGNTDYPEGGRHYLLTDDRSSGSRAFCDGISNSFGGWRGDVDNTTYLVGLFGGFSQDSSGNVIHHTTLMPKRIYWARFYSPDGDLIYDIVPSEEGLLDLVSGQVLPFALNKNRFVYGVEVTE